MNIKIFLFVLIFWKSPENVQPSQIKLGAIDVLYSLTNEGIKIRILNNGKHVLNGTLNNGVDVTDINCDGIKYCNFGNYNLTIEPTEDRIHVLWETNDLAVTFEDCFEFGSAHWYGGPQVVEQRWPIEKVQVNGSEPYVLIKAFAVAERYWLNSKGVYIYLDEKVPLFVEQNVHIQDKVCFSARLESPYINRTRNILDYVIVSKNDTKQAHIDAVGKYLNKPSGRPSTVMITEPIWSTWAKYKKEINTSVVLDFANGIRQQGYSNGQLEIDDMWETCYGSLEVDKVKFHNMTDTVAKLKDMNFRVSLWVHPFVNQGCQNVSNEGIEKSYFVQDINGNIDGAWWDGTHAYQIDFTNPEAAEWYSERLKKLQKETGIDSFKFDAGETQYPPQPAVYHGVDQERVPGLLSENYLRTVAKFGDLIEIRSAYKTQDLPCFMRMVDKRSTWGEEAGLYTLITTLLQLNINGYTLILPDIIGGNGYRGDYPDAEILVRWTQATALMPTMQFSYLPWDITSDEFDAVALVRKFVDLHTNFSSEIIDVMENSVKYGTPVNAPIWWIDPTDETALACDNEFLLGDGILIAPVITQKARSRDVYLPKGEWVDGNNGSIYEGPILLKDYPAPIELLPYFSRIK